jgi:hypothetical protein
LSDSVPVPAFSTTLTSPVSSVDDNEAADVVGVLDILLYGGFNSIQFDAFVRLSSQFATISNHTARTKPKNAHELMR